MGFSVYILKSKRADKYYIGQSVNPELRLEFHNALEKGFTSRYRQWEIVWKKEYPTRREAVRVERIIKGWKSKILIEELIAGKRSV